MKRPVGIALFASGRGSNARSILQACADGRLNARGVLVISNHADAGVHEVAREFSIPSLTIVRDAFETGSAFAEVMLKALRDAGAELICLAGYLRKVPSAVIREYGGAILNIHPALLPNHGGKGMFGLKVHAAVIAGGETETGVTVHFVAADYDTGPILLQRSGVPVLTGDTPESLAARVLVVEHQIYPEAVAKWIASRR